MFETIEARVRHRKASAYAIQFTNGTRDEYDAIIHDTYDEPLIEVDCATIENYDDFFATIADDLVTDMSAAYNQTWAVEEHFEAEGGTLVLHNYHELDAETNSSLAMYIKSLWEGLNFDGDTGFAIAITTDDPGAVFVGNGDLSGRVLTITINEEDN